MDLRCHRKSILQQSRAAKFESKLLFSRRKTTIPQGLPFVLYFVVDNLNLHTLLCTGLALIFDRPLDTRAIYQVDPIKRALTIAEANFKIAAQRMGVSWLPNFTFVLYVEPTNNVSYCVFSIRELVQTWRSPKVMSLVSMKS